MKTSDLEKIPLVKDEWTLFYDDKTLTKIHESTFIKKCMDKTITADELRRFVQQHYHYSRHFTRFICALLSNMEEQRHFTALLDNLCDENGTHQNASTPHSILYQEMAGELGIDLAVSASPSAIALTEKMFEYCSNKNIIHGLSALCLGAEAIVPFLYSRIIMGFLANNIYESTLKFFSIHVECDDAHAEVLQKILTEQLKRSPSNIHLIRQVAAEMIDLRITFLDSLIGEQAA